MLLKALEETHPTVSITLRATLLLRHSEIGDLKKMDKLKPHEQVGSLKRMLIIAY